jgi:hypothetical protein
MAAFGIISDMTPDDLCQNWRDFALNDTLRASGNDGVVPYHTLLAHIRLNLPGQHTVVLQVDRTLLLTCVRECSDNVRPLIDGETTRWDSNEISPYLGWLAFDYEGETLELALAPGSRLHSTAILVGRNSGRLEALSRAIHEHAVQPTGRSLIFSRQWENAPQLDAELGSVTWDDVVLAPAVMSGVRAAVEGFVAHRHAFTTLGFPWRRGLLLVGPPGTGKTMLCKAAASALPELPFLYVRDLLGQARAEVQGPIAVIFKRARRLAPCLLAFEDIDGMINSANRGIFHNELDGFQNNDGLLIIASSNHPGKIDEALLKRPSRFDRVFHIGLPALAERRTYCRRLLSRPELAARFTADLDVETLIENIAAQTDGFTPAYLKEAFISAALDRAQEGAVVLDQSFASAVLDQVATLRHHLQQVKDPDSLGEFINPEAPSVGIRRTRS